MIDPLSQSVLPSSPELPVQQVSTGAVSPLHRGRQRRGQFRPARPSSPSPISRASSTVPPVARPLPSDPEASSFATSWVIASRGSAPSGQPPANVGQAAAKASSAFSDARATAAAVASIGSSGLVGASSTIRPTRPGYRSA